MTFALAVASIAAAGFVLACGMARQRIAKARHGRRRRQVLERRHARFQASARHALAAIEQIGPRENPGRLFAYLRKVPPLVFEEMILTALDERGHPIERSARYTGDGGADGAFSLQGHAWLIQAKRYASAVNPAHVREFDALCRRKGARGLFVHTGRTGPMSRDAERQAHALRILSGQDLVALFAGDKISLLRT